MASDVEKIKERLTIEEVVGSYVELKQSGKYLKAKSPFTNENTPSFYVSPDKGLFHCFSSNKGGDIFTFVEELEGVEFREALKILADRAGVTLSGGSSDGGRKKRLRAIIEEARDFYQKQLKESTTGRDYLRERGIIDKTAERFKLGQAPDEWRVVLEHLQSAGYKTEDIITAGLAKQPDGDKSPYDRFRNRLLFPLNDAAGRPVAFSGRRLDEDSPAKYINSPETPLFRKGQILYGFDLAKDKLRELDAAILVEGQTDLVLAHQAGFENTVASSGTAITEHHLKLIQRFSDNLILALDTDSAGRAAALKTGRLALSIGMKPKVAPLPIDSDPADLINQSGASAFKSVIAQSEDIFDAAINWVRADSSGREGFLDHLQTQVFPLLLSIENEISQDHYISEVAQKADIREKTLRRELAKLSSEAANQETSQKPGSVVAAADSTLLTPRERKSSIHQQLLAICQWQKQADEPVIDPAETEENIAEINGYDIDPDEAPSVTDDEVLVLEITYADKSDKVIKRDVSELLLHFEERVLQLTYDRVSRAVARESDKKKKQELLEKCQRISSRIHEVREEVRNLV
jgi:DNA primase